MPQELSVADESTALSAALQRAIGNLHATSLTTASPDVVDEPDFVREFAHLSAKTSF